MSVHLFSATGELEGGGREGESLIPKSCSFGFGEGTAKEHQIGGSFSSDSGVPPRAPDPLPSMKNQASTAVMYICMYVCTYLCSTGA